MSCLFKIKEAGALFTSTEQRIAEYILQNPEKVVEGSAQELARESDTSPAAWIRFSKKLGYKGLPALKMDLAKDDKENDDCRPSHLGRLSMDCGSNQDDHRPTLRQNRRKQQVAPNLEIGRRSCQHRHRIG